MTTDRAPGSTRPRRRRRPLPAAVDDGFSLLEVLVALAVIGIVMGGAAPFLTKSVALVGQQRSQQVAIEVANNALERARALSPSSLLAGRGLTAVQNQLTAAAGAVTSLMSNTQIASDPATDPTLGADAPLPTAKKPATVGGVTYDRSWYVGRCWQTKADSTQVSTGLGTCLGTQPTGAGVVPVPFFRVVVAVTWQHSGCSNSTCVYVASTLVSPSDDPVFDLKRPPPTIVDPGSKASYIGDTVSSQLVASGGALPRTWTLTGLPTGLAYTANGLITGTTTTAGTYTVAAHVQDRDSVSDDATFTWTVTALPALTSPGARVFRTSTAVSLPVTLTGGRQPVTWTASGLPAGLTINASTGDISGTAPATAQTTPQTATITVVDQGLKTATTTFTWRVVTPVTLGSPGSQTADKGDTINYALGALAGGGLTPYTWTATGLPPGLSLNASTGTVSGTIQAGTRYLVAVTVTDSAGGTAGIVVPLYVNVSSSLRITAPNPTSPDRTSTVGSTVAVTANALPSSGQVWSATGLPAGLAINSSSGAISGKPTTVGTYVTTITVTNASSQVANLMLNWTVTP